MHESFWVQRKQKYLHTLQQRSKWKNMRPNMVVGAVMFLRSPAPPSVWSPNRVVECHPGPDGLIKVVTVCTKGGTLKRPISQLCLHPVLTASEGHMSVRGFV
ncbi:hypothetical protein KM043_015933 [Ampulex compressa]|nr:hypothetical protein KM043_015933 [Ampulex compressa]